MGWAAYSTPFFFAFPPLFIMLALWRELAKNALPAAPTGGRRPLGTS